MLIHCEQCNTALIPDNTGLSDDLCQECWEDCCSIGWWQFIAAAQQLMPELLGIEEESDRT